jgi:hypothetical protein
LLAWLRRRCGPQPNPVRRGIDRAETWLRAVLAVAFLVGAPVLGISLSHWTGAAMTSEAHAQAASRYLVPATLLTTARLAGRYPGAGNGYGWAPARWTGHDGTPRMGEVQTPAGARKGSLVRVWTSRDGRLVPAPLAHTQIVSRMVTVGLLAPLMLGLLLLTAAGAVHRALDRRRMAAWEADWSLVEPQWTRRLH